jgi:hypothetical protein
MLAQHAVDISFLLLSLASHISVCCSYLPGLTLAEGEEMGQEEEGWEEEAVNQREDVGAVVYDSSFSLSG